MKNLNKLIEILQDMKTSKVSNYVIAGLDSYMLEAGNIRMFENSRNHQDQVTPHSHRFDFVCLVLSGHVINKIWTECSEEEGDIFEISTLDYSGAIGEHKKQIQGRSYYSFENNTYHEGQCYSMSAEEIHSIQFSRGAKVLFFEGPQFQKTSLIIEPVVNGEVIKTYESRDYMFKRNSHEKP